MIPKILPPKDSKKKDIVHFFLEEKEDGKIYLMAIDTDVNLDVWCVLEITSKGLRLCRGLHHMGSIPCDGFYVNVTKKEL